MTPDPPSHAPPAKIGEYTVLAVLGECARAVVYAVQEPHMDRREVLKQRKPASAAEGEAFVRAARQMARLPHPHIATIFHVSDGESDAPFFTMEPLPKSLDDWRGERGGRAEPREACEILGGLAEALDTAHAQQMVHGGLKPSNIRATDTMRLFRITDFGQTPPGFAPPPYAAPESPDLLSRIGGSAAFTLAMDQYALAILAFELLTGTRPFTVRYGDDLEIAGHTYTVTAENEAEILRLLHRHVTPPDARLFAPDLPHETAAALFRALSKEPEGRFRSCGAFAEALRPRPTEQAAMPAYIPTGFSGAPPKPLPVLPPVVSAPVAVRIRPPAPAPPPRGTSRAAFGFVLASALFCAGLAAFFFWQWQNRPAAAVPPPPVPVAVVPPKTPEPTVKSEFQLEVDREERDEKLRKRDAQLLEVAKALYYDAKTNLNQEKRPAVALPKLVRMRQLLKRMREPPALQLKACGILLQKAEKMLAAQAEHNRRLQARLQKKAQSVPARKTPARGTRERRRRPSGGGRRGGRDGSKIRKPPIPEPAIGRRNKKIE